MPSVNSHRIDDGFATLVELTTPATIKLYEKEVTPPGYDAGGRNDTTTMRNSAWRTAKPKKLKTATSLSYTAAFAGDVNDDILDAVGVNQLITVTFPEGDTLAVWGWLDKFTPNRFVEGSQPTADVTFEISNQDNTGAEVAPVYTPPPAP